jgi:predicted ferric reductase
MQMKRPPERLVGRGRLRRLQVAVAAATARHLGSGSERLATLLARPRWLVLPRIDTRRKRVVYGVILTGLYVALCLAPLVLVSVGRREPRGAEGSFAIQFSVALGYMGLSMMVLQFALVSRIKWLASPFGIDLLHKFHKEVSFVALAIILAHPVILFVVDSPKYLPLMDVPMAPWRARFGLASIGLLLLLVLLSVGRRLLRLSYELWKMSHGALSLGAVFLALAHIDLVGHYTSGLQGKLLFAAVVAAILVAVAWSRLISPVLQLLRPWRVVRVVRERGQAVTVVVEPVGHEGLEFRPGQFAWVTVGEPPFGVAEQHPFSFASPPVEAAGGRVWLTIAARGDWSGSVARIEPGTRVFLDGPYGHFSIDRAQAPGYVFIAGGVGITPLYSMVAAMCVRRDLRPAILFYASPDWESIVFREQLEALRRYMPNLRVVHILSRPPVGWSGESGHITPAMLFRHLPDGYGSFEYFLCASERMMDEVEKVLLSIGVSPSQIHSERFAMV